MTAATRQDLIQRANELRNAYLDAQAELDLCTKEFEWAADDRHQTYLALRDARRAYETGVSMGEDPEEMMEAVWDAEEEAETSEADYQAAADAWDEARTICHAARAAYAEACCAVPCA